jgi:hypothetical protein
VNSRAKDGFFLKKLQIEGSFLQKGKKRNKKIQIVY